MTPPPADLLPTPPYPGACWCHDCQEWDDHRDSQSRHAGHRLSHDPKPIAGDGWNEAIEACAAELAEFFCPANPPYRSKGAMAEDMTLVIARHFQAALRRPAQPAQGDVVERAAEAWVEAAKAYESACNNSEDDDRLAFYLDAVTSAEQEFRAALRAIAVTK